MSKIYSKTTHLIFFTAILAVFPFLASAAVAPQSISVINQMPPLSYTVGQTITLDLALNTGGNSINALEGTVQVPTDYFDILGVAYTNNNTRSYFLKLWPETPTIHSDGTITFTGGLPGGSLGGFNGTKGIILTMSLKIKKSGRASITPANNMVLLDDGLATELGNVKIIPLAITIANK